MTGRGLLITKIICLSLAQMAFGGDDTAGPCLARHVPERLDDIAWENDRIAFRMYGPELWKDVKKRCGSGVDVRVKKVRYPIINKWYKRKNYHKDEGEGADFYKVGPTRGCGGLGIWRDGKLYVSGHWATHRIITGGGNKLEFELTFAPWKAGDMMREHFGGAAMIDGAPLICDVGQTQED